MDKIIQALTKLFDKHRIVFWYDAKKELRGEYEELFIPGVEKIELDNNQYGVKYHILREEPEQKFLLYHAGPQPDDLNNWLLDVQLAHGTFSADQVSLWMTELGLRQEFFRLVQAHAEFFKAASRRAKLKALLTQEDSHNAVRTKILAVCVNADIEARIESVLEVLLAELAEKRDEKIKLIERCNLETFLWERAAVHFGYTSDTPGVRDFVLDLFKSGYALSLEDEAELNQDALVFLKRWKDSRRYHQSFEVLSDESADILGIKKDLQSRDFRSLIELDFFRLIDLKILGDLVRQVVDRTLSAGDGANLIWRRRTTHWFREFRDIYEAIYYGSQFIAELEKVDPRMQSLSDGFTKYENTWFRLDQTYRKFIYHLRASRQTTLLDTLNEQIENLYSNNFLLTVNDNWQQWVDQTKTWDIPTVIRQDEFFERYIGNNPKNKLVVVISDALRFEIGQEFHERICSQDRYQAELEPILAMLPSYTQLGMAALLPQERLAIMENGTVTADGQNTSGTKKRKKVLSQAVNGGAAAMRSDDLMSMTIDESRAIVRENQVIYVYHNRIDAVGDKRDTEEQIFDAVEAAIDELVDIIKKLSNANVYNMLVTADHGFIYQHRPIDESEFTGIEVEGDEILYRHRRFVFGRGLRQNPSTKVFSMADLGLTGDLEVQIPKSINRLRLKGAGSRYVHGGAALQEVVIPVIKVNKKRASDVGLVEVDLITSSSTFITSGQLSVAFYQKKPVTAKMQARKLRAGIYAQDGTLISDSHELNFDLSSDVMREREVRVRFVLSSKADDVNNQTVYLKLEERVPNTSHYKEYKSFGYQLHRSFTSDFDF